MFPGAPPPHWLVVLSIAIATAFISAGVILVDILRGRPQRMGVMDLVWPITGLYMGPLAMWRIGRSTARPAKKDSTNRNRALPLSLSGGLCSPEPVIAARAARWVTSREL